MKSEKRRFEIFGSIIGVIFVGYLFTKSNLIINGLMKNKSEKSAFDDVELNSQNLVNESFGENSQNAFQSGVSLDADLPFKEAAAESVSKWDESCTQNSNALRKKIDGSLKDLLENNSLSSPWNDNLTTLTQSFEKNGEHFQMSVNRNDDLEVPTFTISYLKANSAEAESGFTPIEMKGYNRNIAVSSEQLEKIWKKQTNEIWLSNLNSGLKLTSNKHKLYLPELGEGAAAEFDNNNLVEVSSRQFGCEKSKKFEGFECRCAQATAIVDGKSID